MLKRSEASDRLLAKLINRPFVPQGDKLFYSLACGRCFSPHHPPLPGSCRVTIISRPLACDKIVLLYTAAGGRVIAVTRPTAGIKKGCHAERSEASDRLLAKLINRPFVPQGDKLFYSLACGRCFSPHHPPLPCSCRVTIICRPPACD